MCVYIYIYIYQYFFLVCTKKTYSFSYATKGWNIFMSVHPSVLYVIVKALLNSFRKCALQIYYIIICVLPSVRKSVCLFVCTYVYMLVPESVCFRTWIGPSIRPSVCLSVCLSVPLGLSNSPAGHDPSRSVASFSFASDFWLMILTARNAINSAYTVYRSIYTDLSPETSTKSQNGANIQ